MGSMNDSMVHKRHREVAGAALALIAFVACALWVFPGEADSRPVAYKLVKNLYNDRYCEIFLIQTDTGKLEVDIYNTTGINDCPAEKWDPIVAEDGLDPSLDSIASAKGADLAAANGPRHWVLDAIGGRNIGKTVSLGGLEMRRVAGATFDGQPPSFTELTIRRSTQWIFNKGRRVRELISPSGRHYVMQAYAGSDIKSEAELDPRNTPEVDGGGLPSPDWKYRTFTVKKKKWVLTAKNKAIIVRDGLQSVYQYYKFKK